MRLLCAERRCAARPASHERMRATSCAEMAVSSLTSCRIAQRNRAKPAILFSCMLQQLLGDGEIHQCGVDVLVSHVCSQVWEIRLRIDALSVPSQHTVDHKGMAQIVNPWSLVSISRFQPRSPQYP